MNESVIKVRNHVVQANYGSSLHKRIGNRMKMIENIKRFDSEVTEIFVQVQKPAYVVLTGHQNRINGA